jgi:hypothetical protein
VPQAYRDPALVLTSLGRKPVPCLQSLKPLTASRKFPAEYKLIVARYQQRRRTMARLRRAGLGLCASVCRFAGVTGFSSEPSRNLLVRLGFYGVAILRGARIPPSSLDRVKYFSCYKLQDAK